MMLLKLWLLTISCICLSFSKELELLSEMETQVLMNDSVSFEETYFLLICYQKNIRCIEAENELQKALDELSTSQFSGMIATMFQFRRVECIVGYARELCHQFGHNHKLKPARIQIIANIKVGGQVESFRYKFSSPLLSDYIKRKIMKFTIPDPVMAFSGNVSDLTQFDDIRQHQNVIFALKSEDPNIIAYYESYAASMKERFYFFKIQKQPSNDTQASLKEKSYIYAVGYNFTREFQIVYLPHNPSMTKLLIEKSIEEGQLQDLLLWNYQKHILNETYLQSLEGKLLIVGMAGLQTDYLTSDFLYEFRKLAQEYRYSLNKYAFAIIDIDNEEMFNYLITYNLGRFDSPGIFAIRDINRKVFYRNYETFQGHNFDNISEQFIASINRKEKMPLYAKWQDCYLNLVNFEHWMNNKMKTYMYILGLITIFCLPFLILIDCFYPILGRGPNEKKRTSHKPTQEKSKKE